MLGEWTDLTCICKVNSELGAVTPGDHCSALGFPGGSPGTRGFANLREPFLISSQVPGAVLGPWIWCL